MFCVYYFNLELRLVIESGTKLKEPEAVAWRCSVKMKIPQNSQENFCASLILNKVVGWTSGAVDLL